MRHGLIVLVVCSLLLAQDQPHPVFRTNVQMVVLAFSVTDSKGRSVTGLRPDQIRIYENGVPEQIDAFSEGSRTVLANDGEVPPAGISVFILFDTSNSMYRMFSYAYDAVADFVRRLATQDAVALYTFSRNVARAASLTSDRGLTRAGLRNIVAGDDTALFNAILLTLRDAAKVPGRKAIVVFSNGRDNASVVSPDDVARVAEDSGVPIYIVSTQDPEKERPLAAALHALTKRSGGKLYWAPRWQDQNPTFQSVHSDIVSSYTAYYYPASEAGPGFRHIEVKIVAPESKNWHVRVRAGYEAQSDANLTRTKAY